jgi:hypothetical protein
MLVGAVAAARARAMPGIDEVEPSDAGAGDDLAVAGTREVPERWTVPGAIVAAVRQVESRPLGERFAVATESLLGLPYLQDAAGEMDGDDPDAPSRYDTFDCLTFIEDMLAVAMAGDPLHGPAIRDAFRYRGDDRRYAERNHFMEAEWLPSAVERGLLEDITPRMGPWRTLQKEVTRETWRRWGRRSLFRLPEARLPMGTWRLTYLDLAEAVAAVPNVPAGAIVVTVRIPRDHIPVAITHVGVALAGAREPIMRHATRMTGRRVRDDRLSWYVDHLRDYVNWPALGISVYMPVEQGPRASALEPVALPGVYSPAQGPLPQFTPRPNYGAR